MRNGDDEVNHGEFILMAGYVFHHMLTLEKGIVMFEAMNRNQFGAVTPIKYDTNVVQFGPS